MRRGRRTCKSENGYGDPQKQVRIDKIIEERLAFAVNHLRATDESHSAQMAECEQKIETKMVVSIKKVDIKLTTQITNLATKYQTKNHDKTTGVLDWLLKFCDVMTRRRKGSATKTTTSTPMLKVTTMLRWSSPNQNPMRFILQLQRTEARTCPHQINHDNVTGAITYTVGEPPSITSTNHTSTHQQHTTSLTTTSTTTALTDTDQRGIVTNSELHNNDILPHNNDYLDEQISVAALTENIYKGNRHINKQPNTFCKMYSNINSLQSSRERTASMHVSHNSTISSKNYLPGGAASIITAKWSSNIIRQLHDDECIGRWMTTSL